VTHRNFLQRRMRDLVALVWISVRAVRRGLFGVGRRRLLIGGSVMLGVPLIAMVGVSAYSLHATSQPSFCGNCHVMQPYIDAWHGSTHGEVNCEECHIPPGGAAFVGGKIGSIQVVIDYWRGNYDMDRSFSAVVSNASCLRCHESLVTEGPITTSEGLIVDHRGIIRLGEKCMTCHSTVAHEAVMPVGARTFPTMQTCFKCHDGTTASTQCSLCHVTSRNGT
jgi:nitrate/TMAO reductase-like tetraheme cytochrome c subunit